MARSKIASRNTRKTVARHRTLQRRRTRDDGRHPAEAKAMQAGARRYPIPPMPRQHQRKPATRPASIRRRCSFKLLDTSR
jgi:hypothetical protein